MGSVFKILNNGKIETYNKFDDIPSSFDNVIAFEPEIPPPPHTKEQHEEIDLWPEKLQELMKRETK